MKVYEITFNDEHKVSLVKSPAIESTLLKFSDEENETLYFAKDEKKVIYQVVLFQKKIFLKKKSKESQQMYFTPLKPLRNFNKIILEKMQTVELI